MTEPKRDWRKIKYYPVSMEKLERASMKEAAYLIAPMNIGEDYEYFDKVKHLLIIPEKPKTLEEIKQELDKEFEELLVKIKRKSHLSKQIAEREYEDKFDRISYNFQCAVNNGFFPQYLSLTTSGNATIGNASIGNVITYNFVLKPDAIGVGYWEIDPKIQVYRKTKPNRIVRYFSRLLLDFHWKDTP